MKTILLIEGNNVVGKKLIKSFNASYQFINYSDQSAMLEANANIIDKFANRLSFNIDFADIDFVVDLSLFNTGYDEKHHLNKIQHIIAICKNHQIENFIHFSQLLPKQISLAETMEELLKQAAVNFIIFKNQFVFGVDNSLEFMLNKIANLSHFNPALGDLKLAPIHIDDLLNNVKAALEHKNVWQKSYVLQGPEEICLKDIAKRLGSGKSSLQIPDFLVRCFIVLSMNKVLKDIYQRLVRVNLHLAKQHFKSLAHSAIAY